MKPSSQILAVAHRVLIALSDGALADVAGTIAGAGVRGGLHSTLADRGT